jgi:hypothetical protein
LPNVGRYESLIRLSNEGLYQARNQGYFVSAL